LVVLGLCLCDSTFGQGLLGFTNCTISPVNTNVSSGGLFTGVWPTGNLGLGSGFSGVTTPTNASDFSDLQISYTVISWSTNFGNGIVDFASWYNNPANDSWVNSSTTFNFPVNPILNAWAMSPTWYFSQMSNPTLGQLNGLTTSISVAATPEPSALALLTLSSGWLMLRVNRRK